MGYYRQRYIHVATQSTLASQYH